MSATRSREKPQLGVQIAWGHPLTRGLTGVWLFREAGAGGVLNLVDGVRGGTAAVTSDAVLDGESLRAAASANSGARGSADFTGMGAAMSLFWRGVPAGTTAGYGPFFFGFTHSSVDVGPYTALALCGNSPPDGTAPLVEYNTGVTFQSLAGTTGKIVARRPLSLGVSRRSGSTVLYENGIAAASDSVSGDIGYTTPRLGIACRGVANGSYTGATTTVAYAWNRYLTADEQALLHADPFCFLAPNVRSTYFAAPILEGGSGAIAGSSAGAATVSGTLTGTGALAGASAGVAAPTGTLTATGALAGASAGAATVSGALAAAGTLSGASAGVATVLAALGATGALVGSSAGTASVSGSMGGESLIIGSCAGSASCSGTVTGNGSLSATAAGVATVSATLLATGALAGASAGTATVSGAAGSNAPIAGSSAGSAACSGTVTGNGSLSATAAGVATVTAVLLATGALSGTSGGTSTASLLMATPLLDTTGLTFALQEVPRLRLSGIGENVRLRCST